MSKKKETKLQTFKKITAQLDLKPRDFHNRCTIFYKYFDENISTTKE